MCAASVDWITFSGLSFIVLLSAIMVVFLIVYFSKEIAKLDIERKEVIDYLKEQDNKID